MIHKSGVLLKGRDKNESWRVTIFSLCKLRSKVVPRGGKNVANVQREGRERQQPGGVRFP